MCGVRIISALRGVEESCRIRWDEYPLGWAHTVGVRLQPELYFCNEGPSPR